jgi:hypothetical protein
MPNASVQQPAEISYYSRSTLFYVLTCVLHMKFRQWKWIPPFYRKRIKRNEWQWAKSLEISLFKEQRWNWLNFWAGHESRITWDDLPTGSWSPLDEEMSQRIRQTTGAKIQSWAFSRPCWVSDYRWDTSWCDIYYAILRNESVGFFSSADGVTITRCSETKT